MRLRLNNTKAFTLLELLIALILVTVIAISIFSMDLFGRYHLISVDRRRRVQNQVSDVLEHISRHIINTIGNPYVTGSNPVYMPDTRSIEIYIDQAVGGGAGDGQSGTGGDKWIAYCYDNTTYEVKYCADYDNLSSACDASSCNAGWETVGKNIRTFVPTTEANYTYVAFDISGCWNLSETDPTKHCGTSDNPAVTMKTRFNLPSVAQR